MWKRSERYPLYAFDGEGNVKTESQQINYEDKLYILDTSQIHEIHEIENQRGIYLNKKLSALKKDWLDRNVVLLTREDCIRIFRGEEKHE